MDNARDVVVDSNYVFSTDPNYYRGSTPATGILVGAETWPVIAVIWFALSWSNPILDYPCADYKCDNSEQFAV